MKLRRPRQAGRRAFVAILACAATVALSACLGGPSVSRSDVLVSLVPSVVIPLHEGTAASLQTLNAVAQSACETQPVASAEINDLRESWRAARSAVSRSRAVEFGPAADRHASSLIDWDTLDAGRVDMWLAGDADVTATSVREFMPATARGLRAVEYIVFDDVALDAARCQYVIAITEAAAVEAQAVLDEWTGTGTAAGNEPYADVFTGTASSSLLPLAAVSDVVSTSIFLTRAIVDMQLGAALGIDGAEVDIAAIGEGLAGNGVADLRDAVVGMKSVYLGALEDAPASGDADTLPFGISDLVSGASPDADVRVAEAFETAFAAIDSLAASGESLTSLLTNDRGAVMDCYRALEELQLTLNTEVVSLLGISVGFADTDGDSG